MSVSAKRNKEAGKVNKSEEIRKLIVKQPNASAKQIANWLKIGKGITVNPSAVYVVRNAMKKKKSRKFTARSAGDGVRVTNANGDGVTFVEPKSTSESTYAVNTVIEVVNLSKRIGGIGKMKELVDALA